MEYFSYSRIATELLTRTSSERYPAPRPMASSIIGNQQQLTKRLTSQRRFDSDRRDVGFVEDMPEAGKPDDRAATVFCSVGSSHA